MSIEFGYLFLLIYFTETKGNEQVPMQKDGALSVEIQRVGSRKSGEM